MDLFLPVLQCVTAGTEKHKISARPNKEKYSVIKDCTNLSKTNSKQ